MSYLSASQSQVEIEDQPIVRPFRASALLSTHLPPTQHHPPSFPGIGQTLDAEDRALPNEGRMTDVGPTHFQATVNMDGSDSHMQSPPAASSTPPVISPEEHMNSSVILHPKTKERTWPLLQVACRHWSEEEYTLSFKKVVEYLREMVDHHDRLRNSARHILYRLMMVGSSLESAKPSVLVMCNATDWSSLNSLLKRMPSQEYNCMIPSTWDRAHKLRFRDRGLSRMSTLKPILWLYLCPTSFETLKRLYGVPVSIECSSLVTMCGSLVEFEGRQSTISLSLDIDGEDRLLTVDHIFQDDELENYKPQTNLDPESRASIESNIEQWDRFNDSEDDISMDIDTNLNHDDTQMDRELPTIPVDYNSSQVSYEPMRAIYESRRLLSRTYKQGERVEPPNSLPHRSPYLDWACLRLVDYQMVPRQRCNFLLRPGKPPGLLEDFATKLGTHAVPVFMISGIVGVRSGRLIDLPSYLGSTKEQDLCETWTIILNQEEDTCFHPGESGSIVVDQETLKIYGHLVGSDMFGYGHVVPFSHTMEQIRTAFKADNAGLPTLKSSGSHQEGDMDNEVHESLDLLLYCPSPAITMARYLIEQGADVNRPNTYGETPLLIAVTKEHEDIIELLLENGADPSLPDGDGKMLLDRAIDCGSLQIVKLLLSVGVEVNLKDELNQTPLWRAIQNGHYDMVKVLVEAGANVNTCNKYGQTPLQPAAAMGQYHTLELLCKAGAEVNTTDDAVRVALLLIAIKERDSDHLQQLIKAGAEVNARDGNGNIPLLSAVEIGHSDTVQQLIKAGAEVNVRDKYGKTPLFIARQSNIVQQLLEAGAEVNARDNHGETPLFFATQSNIVQQLLEAGAEVNARDNRGKTPLFFATQSNIVQLLEAGAEVNARDIHGKTPLLFAASYTSTDITQLLIRAGAEVNTGDKDGCTPLLSAVQARRSDLIQQLIEANADLNIRDHDGGTPLLYTALHGYSDITQQLIDAGAELDVGDKDGHTPLLIATRYGHSDIIQQLIKASALLDSKDNQGQTALLIAVQRRNYGIIQILMEGGAATDVEDNRGRTPLTLAKKLKVDLFMHLTEAKDSVDEREG